MGLVESELKGEKREISTARKKRGGLQVVKQTYSKGPCALGTR